MSQWRVDPWDVVIIIIIIIINPFPIFIGLTDLGHLSHVPPASDVTSSAVDLTETDLLTT